MRGGTFVITSAAALALLLAGYAVWTTTQGDAGQPSAAPAKGSDRAPTPQAPDPQPRKPPIDPRPPIAKTRARVAPEASPRPSAREPAGARKTRAEIADQRFQGPRNLFESAATALRDPDATLSAASVTALLLQAKLSIKDMSALADPDQPAHAAELRRIEKDFAALQAEFDG